VGCEEKTVQTYYPDGDIVKRDKKGNVTERIPAKKAKKQFGCYLWEDIEEMARYIKLLEAASQ